ncbi:CPBP family intramembrane metalloprotease [Bacillus cytotoxicus]|uniref:CPBP family intramembrane metalloprotease n=1 Tax=Bacillus cytotoxicus TaxID=580165 RepID=A0ACC6A6L3_9BACI|nr:CPBP family intramembrane metalloprotease [Bacillus cytotoxicus]
MNVNEKLVISAVLCGSLFMVVYVVHSVGLSIGEIAAAKTHFMAFKYLGSLLGVLMGISIIVMLSKSLRVKNSMKEIFEIKPIKFLEIVPIRKIRIRDAFLIMLLVIFELPLVNFLDELGKGIFGDYTQVFGTLSEKTNFFVFVLGLSIFGPILEELLTRGLVLYQFRSYNPVIAVIITTVTFSVMHANPHQATYTLSSSIIYTLVTFATGSILASILAHGIHNLIATVFVYYFPEVTISQWYVVIPCTIIVVILLYILLKKSKVMSYWKGEKTDLIFPCVFLFVFTAFFVMDPNVKSYELFVFWYFTCIGLYICKQITMKNRIAAIKVDNFQEDSK